MAYIFNSDAVVIGSLTISPNNATGNFLTIDGTGVVRFRTPAEVLSDIGVSSPLTTKARIKLETTKWETKKGDIRLVGPKLTSFPANTEWKIGKTMTRLDKLTIKKSTKARQVLLDRSHQGHKKSYFSICYEKVHQRYINIYFWYIFS